MYIAPTLRDLSMVHPPIRSLISIIDPIVSFMILTTTIVALLLLYFIFEYIGWLLKQSSYQQSHHFLSDPLPLMESIHSHYQLFARSSAVCTPLVYPCILSYYKDLLRTHLSSFDKYTHSRVTVQSNDHSIMFGRPSGPIFDSPLFDNRLLNVTLLELTYERLPEIFGSLSKVTSASFEKRCDYTEFVRSLAFAKRSWWSSDQSIIRLKHFLIDHVVDANIPNVSTCAFTTPFLCKFPPNPHVKFPSLPAKCFNPTTTRRGVDIPPLLSFDTAPNFLHDFVQPLVPFSHNKCLPVTLIKAIIRSQLENKQLSHSEIIQYFSDRCYLIPSKGDIDYRKLAWIVSYIPTQYFYYTVSNDEEFFRLFKSQIVELRASVLAFVRQYLDVSLLTMRQRRVLQQQRSDFIKAKMQTLQSSQLFAAGETHDIVANYVYNTYINDFSSRIFKVTVLGKNRSDRKTASERDIQKNRDRKYASFETESHENFSFEPMCANHPSLLRRAHQYMQLVFDYTIRSLIFVHPERAFHLIAIFFANGNRELYGFLMLVQFLNLGLWYGFIIGWFFQIFLVPWHPAFKTQDSDAFFTPFERVIVDSRNEVLDFPEDDEEENDFDPMNLTTVELINYLTNQYQDNYGDRILPAMILSTTWTNQQLMDFYREQCTRVDLFDFPEDQMTGFLDSMRTPAQWLEDFALDGITPPMFVNIFTLTPYQCERVCRIYGHNALVMKYRIENHVTIGEFRLLPEYPFYTEAINHVAGLVTSPENIAVMALFHENLLAGVYDEHFSDDEDDQLDQYYQETSLFYEPYRHLSDMYPMYDDENDSDFEDRNDRDGYDSDHSFTTQSNDHIMFSLGVFATIGSIFYWLYHFVWPQVRPFRPAVTVVRATKNWHKFLTSDGRLSDSDKILAFEFKTLVHCIYHVYNNDYASCIEWASNFLISRPEKIKEALMSVDFSKLSLARPEHPRFNYNGLVYECDVKDFNYIADAIVNDHPHLETILVDKARLVDTEFEPQAGEDFTNLFSSLASAVNTNGYMELSEKQLREANMQFTYCFNDKKNWDNRTKLMSTVISVIGRTIFGFDPFDPAQQNFSYGILQVIDEINFFQLQQLGTDKKLLGRVLTVHQTACIANADPRMNTIPTFMRTYYLSRFKILEEMAKEATVLFRGTHQRVEPLMVVFIGPAGTGKSASSKILQQGICRFDDQIWSPEMTFAFSGIDQYWEGYKNQKFVFMDDMFKQKDITMRTTEASAIIGMVNNSVFPLNMAFAEKGTAFFDSEYILASTNLAAKGLKNEVWQVGLTHVPAMIRRFHLILYRKDPVESDAMDNVYSIEQSILDESLVGTSVTTLELISLLYNLKQKQKEIFATRDYSPDRLDKLLKIGKYAIPVVVEDAPPLVDQVLPLTVDEVVTQADTAVPDAKKEIEPTFTSLDYIEKLMRVFYWHYIKGSPYYDPESKEMAQMIQFFFLVVGFATAGAFLYAWMFPRVETQSDPSNKTDTSSAYRRKFYDDRAPKTTVAGKRNIAKFKAQANEDNFMKSLLYSVSKSVVYAQCTNSERSSNCTGFHLKNGIFVFPAHFIIPYVGKPTQIEMFWENGDCVTMLPEDIYKIETEDMMFFRVRPKSNLPAELYKHLVDSKEMRPIMPGTPLKLVSRNERGDPVVSTLHKAPHLSPFAYEKHGETFDVEFCVNYYEDTKGGESGSLVMIEGPQGKPIVAGMHVGRKGLFWKDCGIAIPLFKDCIDAYIAEAFTTQSEQINMIPHEILRYVEPSVSHWPPTVSQLKRSKMYEWNGPAKSIPAHLRTFTNRDGEKINPLAKAMSKLHQEPTPETEIPDHVMDYLFKLYPRREKGSRLLSFEECLNGDPDFRTKAIYYATSPGYPYSLAHKKGKAPYIEKTNEQTLAFQPEFLADLEHYDEELNKGNQIEVLYADVLKDETRPVEKVREGKTRMFSTCPLHYLFLVRKYFMDIVESIQSQASVKPICVGLNVHSLDWRFLYNRLNSTNRSVIAGDFTNYDGMLPRFVGRFVLAFINAWYNDGPINARIRELLFEHIYNATHICFDSIYQVIDGNPSGNPITSIYNSLCNIVMCCVILLLDLKLSYDQFQLAVYGDDNVITTLAPGLRCVDLAPHFLRRFGMTYTHFSKAAVEPYDTLETIRFLSRSFVYYDSVYHAPLELDTITEIPYWTRGQTMDEAILATATSFFLELSHHPKDVFDSYSEKYFTAVKERAPHLLHHVRDCQLTYHTYFERHYVAGKRVVTPFVTQSRDLNPIVASSPDAVNPTDNTSVTTRAVNELVDTQIHELGAFQDAAPLLHTVANSEPIQSVHTSNNMETFDMGQSLNRMFALDNGLVWDTSDAIGTTLATYTFPDELFSEDYIASKIEDFCYFKAGIRFSIRMTATPFVFGKIIAYFQPFMGERITSTDIFTATGHKHVLVSANASEAVTFDVPFVSPYRFLDINQYTNGEMGALVIMVFNELQHIQGETNSAQILVSAQFLDATVQLPFDGFIDEVGYVPPIARRARAMKASAFVTQSSSNNKGAEAVRKATQGTISRTLDGLSTLAGGLQSFPLVGGYASTVSAIAGRASGAARMLGLSKPISTQVGQIVDINPHYTFNHSDGICTVPKLGNFDNGISTEPNVGGVSEDEMSIRNFVGTPMMVSQTFFVSGTPASLIGSTTRTDAHICYVDALSQLFFYTSGSYKFKIYITSSSMFAVRMVFFLGRTADDNYNDSYFRVIDFQGDTEVEIMVPYTDQLVTRTLVDANDFGLYAQVLSWSQADASADCRITLNTYKAGAEDFRVGTMVDKTFTCQHNPQEDFNKPFEPLHPSMTGYVPANVVLGEEYTTLRQMIHRFIPISQTSGTTLSLDIQNYTRTTGTLIQGFNILALFFRFWRGSIRFKFLENGANHRGVLYMTVDGTVVHGVTMSNQNLFSRECEVPYYTNMLFNPTDEAPAHVIKLNTTVSGTNLYECTACGDDFSFHWKFPPPQSFLTGALAATASTRGVAGLATYLNAS